MLVFFMKEGEEGGRKSRAGGGRCLHKGSNAGKI